MRSIKITTRDAKRELYLSENGRTWTPDKKRAGRWARGIAFAKAMALEASRRFPPTTFDGGPELVPVV